MGIERVFEKLILFLLNVMSYCSAKQNFDFFFACTIVGVLAINSKFAGIKGMVFATVAEDKNRELVMIFWTVIASVHGPAASTMYEEEMTKLTLKLCIH